MGTMVLVLGESDPKVVFGSSLASVEFLGLETQA